MGLVDGDIKALRIGIVFREEILLREHISKCVRPVADKDTVFKQGNGTRPDITS